MLTEGWVHVTLPSEGWSTDPEEIQRRQARLMWLIQAFGKPASWDDDGTQPETWIRHNNLYWFATQKMATAFLLRWG